METSISTQTENTVTKMKAKDIRRMNKERSIAEKASRGRGEENGNHKKEAYNRNNGFKFV